MVDETDWTNTTQMDPSVESGSVTNLQAGEAYDLRVITQRTVTVPIVRRRRRQALENDATVGISATVSYVTCPTGREGLNCEVGEYDDKNTLLPPSIYIVGSNTLAQ